MLIWESFVSDDSFGELIPVDCDFVIGKFRMHGRNLIFRHMASYTVVVCNLAHADGMTFQRTTLWRMATHADFVVEGGIFHSGFVGVVAGGAGESRVAVSPASALL